jgi:exopolysaccharide biosynthesis predicted pyruvyltransferase EpsI
MSAVIGESRDVALLDVPNQRNVGDALIWAGEVEYLSALGLRIRYAADIQTLSVHDLRKAMPTGVVLLHGGGNFGDLWTGHQQQRENIARSLADYRVVQLPQTLYFRDPEAAARANAVLGAHPDFHAMLRDTPSMRRAAEQLPDVAVSFCYDMALGWQPPVRRPGEPRALSDVTVIARADKESASGLDRVSPSWLPDVSLLRTDWHNSGRRLVQWRLHRHVAARLRQLIRRQRATRFTAPPGTNLLLRHTLTRINRINIEGGAELIGSGRIALVDRLHAHVLAALLGQDHVLLDNSYGKVKAIFDDYTGAFSTARFAHDLDEARAMVEELLAPSRA